MLGDEERLSASLAGSEAQTMESRALVIVRVLDPFEPELILEEVFEEPGKASGGQRLPPVPSTQAR